jgi:threonine dehydrogenase-like Zn-dependent dehydrogenase
LKSTYHGVTTSELWPVVVNELNIVGSRCGRFAPAIELLASHAVDVRRLISAEYAIEDGLAAFAHAARPGSLKVLLRFD